MFVGFRAKTRRMRKAIAVVLFFLVGCKDKAPPPVATTATTETKPASSVRYIVAKPVITRSPIPSRFRAPIPHDRKVVDTKPETFPPYPYMQAAIEANTDGMRERLMTSIRIATGKGPAAEDMAAWYPRLIGYSPSDQVCDWLVGVATGTEPAHLRTVFWRMAEHCRDPKYTTRMTGDEVPDELVVEAYSRLGEPVPFNPRVARAAAAYAKNKANEDYLDVIGAAFANMGPEALPAFAAIHKGLPETAAARAASGLMRSPDKAMRALAEKACTNPVVAKERQCTERDEPTTPRALARGETEQASEELVKCAKGDGYEAAECLQKLAMKDRAAAIAIAKAAPPTGKQDYFSKVARDLVAYPEADAIEKYFASIGITPTATASQSTSLGIESALLGYGRLDQFDTETGQYPNEHDSLLAGLAKLASPALDGVVFEELAPGIDSDGPYTLYAYSDRQRFEVSAQNNGDWYDMDAVIGILNAVLENRSSPYRYVVLPTGDQTAIVMAAPQRAIERLVADGAITLADANAAMNDGKEFEEKAIEALRKRGDLGVE